MISNYLFTKFQFIYKIFDFYSHPKLNPKIRFLFYFIKIILIEFKFIKEKSFNLIFYLQRNDFGLHFIKKKKKTRFHRNINSIFSKMIFIRKKGLLILIQEPNFNLLRKQNFTTFIYEKYF